jgi:hypothetical protein
VSFFLAEATLCGGLVSAAFAFASFSSGAGKLTRSLEGLSSRFGTFQVDRRDGNVFKILYFNQVLSSKSARLAILFLAAPLVFLTNSKLMAS